MSHKYLFKFSYIVLIPCIELIELDVINIAVITWMNSECVYGLFMNFQKEQSKIYVKHRNTTIKIITALCFFSYDEYVAHK